MEIEGKISRGWIHIDLLRINFFWRTREMNLAGVSEDFGPHSRSVVLYACQIFFYEKFFWTEFFLEQGSEIFSREARKIFGRKFLAENSVWDFRRKQNFFCLMSSRIFQKTEKDFFKTASKFFETDRKIFLKRIRIFFETKRFLVDGIKIFLKHIGIFLRQSIKIFYQGNLFRSENQ